MRGVLVSEAKLSPGASLYIGPNEAGDSVRGSIYLKAAGLRGGPDCLVRNGTTLSLRGGQVAMARSLDGQLVRIVGPVEHALPTQRFFVRLSASAGSVFFEDFSTEEGIDRAMAQTDAQRADEGERFYETAKRATIVP